MEEIKLRQIKQQIDLQVGEQIGQIKRMLIESLHNKVDWQLDEQVRQVSNKISIKIWQKTVMGNNYHERFDENGCLINSEDWSIEVAERFAMEEGVEMTDMHWEIIRFMREYYEEYRIPPMIKIVVKAVGRKLGPEKVNIGYLYELFPGGLEQQACKIAGLPSPTM